MLNPLKDLELSSGELKKLQTYLQKKKSVKGYESMSKDRVLRALKTSELLKEGEKNSDDTKPKIHFSKARIEKI